MPIDSHLLERIKMNEPTLKRLDLSRKGLNAQDIQELVKALATNTILTSLNVSYNQIGDEGAKALAANTILTTLKIGANRIGAKGAKALAANTTLTRLYISINKISSEGAKAFAANTTLITLNLAHNKICDDGAKALAANTTLATLSLKLNLIYDKGAKALAANTTLATLNLGINKIGDEGAKALAANTTLTTLNVISTKISEAWKDKLNDVINENRKQLLKRRDQFIQSLFILARDRANPYSHSLSHQLPNDILLQIINMLDFRSTESIGKSAQQIKACAAFIFNHTVEMSASLTKAVEEKQNFKLVEKIVNGKHQFYFFPANVEIKTQEKEITKNATKIRKIM